jgi:hypothetical protein
MFEEVSTAINSLSADSPKDPFRAVATVVNHLSKSQIHTGIYRGLFPKKNYPRVAGIYGLFDMGELVYIGQTRDLVRRLTDHINCPPRNSGLVKPFDHVAFFSVPVGSLIRIEERLIWLFPTRANGGTTKKIKKLSL